MTRGLTALAFLILLSLLAVSPVPAGAQEPEPATEAAATTGSEGTAEPSGEPGNCTVVRRLDNGSVQVVIDGEPYLAITPDMARESLKLKADLDAAEAKLDVKEREIETFKQEVAAFERTLTAKNEQIALLEEVKEDYKELAEGYKKLDRRGWLSFEGGVGAVDGDPAVLLGLGVSKFRVWGFSQEGNNGVMFGVQYPIF